MDNTLQLGNTLQLKDIRERLDIPKVDERDISRTNSLIYGLLFHLKADGYVVHNVGIGFLDSKT